MGKIKMNSNAVYTFDESPISPPESPLNESTEAPDTIINPSATRGEHQITCPNHAKLQSRQLSNSQRKRKRLIDHFSDSESEEAKEDASEGREKKLKHERK